MANLANDRKAIFFTAGASENIVDRKSERYPVPEVLPTDMVNVRSCSLQRSLADYTHIIIIVFAVIDGWA